VQGECLGITCREHSFCQKGLCYCRVGYHPEVDICLAGTPTGSSDRPALAPLPPPSPSHFTPAVATAAGR
jgi:hypothetical protein